MKKFYLSTILLFSCSLIFAQNSIMFDGSTAFANVNSHTIVRTVPSMGEQYVISFLNESGKNYFCLTKIFGTPPYNIYIIPCPSDLVTVYDIKTFGNIVYFCGQNINAIGFFGYFNLNDFFSTTSSLQVYSITNFCSLNKMIIYNNSNGSEKLVATGFLPHNNSCISNGILEATNPSSSSILINYYDLTDASNGNINEYVYDVVLTHHFVLFVGKQLSPSNRPLCIRRAHRDNIPGTIENLYEYSFPAGEINHAVYATYMIPDKKLAVAYVHPGTTPQFTTRTHIINAETDMSVTSSQEYVIDNKYEPYEMTYISSDKKIVILHNCLNSISSHSKFFILDPTMTISNNMPMLYSPSIEFSSLDLTRNSYFISVGGPFWFLQRFPASFDYGSTQCPMSMQNPVHVLPPATVEISRSPLNPHIPSNISNGYIRETRSSTVFVYCQESNK